MLVKASFLSLLCLTLASPARAGAQDLEAEVEYDREFGSVQAEADAATGLYVTTLVLGVGGLGTLLGGSVASLGCATDCADAEIALAVGVGALAAALIALIVASILDERSADRRRRLGRERISFGVAPSEGGLSLSFLGRF